MKDIFSDYSSKDTSWHGSDAISPKVADVLEKVMSAESGLVNHEETSPHYTAHNQSAAYSNHSQDKDEAHAGLPLLSNLYHQNSFCSYPDSTYSRRDSEQSDSSPQYSHPLTPSDKFSYRREETDSSNLPNPDSKVHKDEEEPDRKPGHPSFHNSYKAADLEPPAPTSFYGNARPSEEDQVTEEPPYPRKEESGSPLYNKHCEANPDGPSLTREADSREGELVLNGSFSQEQDEGTQNTSHLNSSFNDSYHSDEDSSTEGLRSGLNESNSEHLLPEDYKNYSFHGITSTPLASPGYLGNRRFSLTSNPRSIDPSSPTFNSYSKQTGLYFCHLCSFSAKCKDDFDAHMSIHFEYSCPHCDYTSRTEGRLKRHIKDFHSSDSDGFGTAKMQRMQPGRPKVYRCKQCSFASTTKVDFWQHSRSHIKEEKLLQCPRCPFVTEYKHHLEYHLRNHFGSKPFKCNKCNYSCVNKSMLNSHMKSHTNVYQYRCADCTYATKYCHSLKLHLKKYNHKPAAVLNADGSLPQGLEPETSGLSLLAKRGPPRGPRGPRKDKMDQYMSPLFHLPQSSIPGMHPGLNSGLMAPYWPLLNGMQPPPPLIPVNNMPGQMRPPQSPQSSSPGKYSKGELGSTKCNLCSFKADSPEGLHAHVLKVHAAGENQDLFSMFGISSEALLDEQNLKAHLARQRSLTKPDRVVTPTSRHNTMLHVQTDQGSTPSKTSPHSWPANQLGGHPHQPNTSRSLPELAYSSRNGQDPTSPQEPVEGADILKQMTLKFGGGGSAVTPRIRKESPLDLTKPKSVSPPAYSPLSGMHHILPHDTPLMPIKRPFQEVDVPSSNDSTENAVPSPRKRSRKGKAYKLDTLCLKLQEKQSGSPYDSESEESSSEVPPQEYVTETRTQSVEGSPNGRGESPGSLKVERGKFSPPHKGDEDMANGLTSSPVTHKNDFEQIHENLKILNSGIKPEPQSPNGDSHSNFENNDQRETPSPDNGMNKANMPKDYEGKPRMISEYMRHQKPPMTSALRRGAELAWKILQDSGPDGAPVQNGEIVLENPPNGLHPLRTDKSLTLPSELSLNALNHSKTKPFRGADSFECHYCEIAFRDCVMYTMHMGYHGYQDPYKCNMCGHCSKDKVEFFLHIARAAHN